MSKIKRKVIQIANSTQLVSLPRKWALRNNIKKGDELDIAVEGNKMTVSTEAQPELLTTTLKLTTADKFLRRSIDVLYKYGYDVVEVQFDDPSVMDMLQKSLSQLLGFEIVSQSSTGCVIKSIAAGSETDLDNVMRRLFLMVDSMISDAYESISKKDMKMLYKVEHFDDVINKFSNFCQRLLNKHGYKEYKKMVFIFYITCVLEQVGDEFKHICIYALNHMKKPLSNDILGIYQDVAAYFRDFHRTFYDKDLDKRFNVKQRRVKIEERIQAVLEKKTGVEAVIACHLHNVVHLTKHMAVMIV